MKQYPPARIVEVLKRKISSHSKVLIYGPRDVGKSLYVRYALYTLAKSEKGEQFIPVFLRCPVDARSVHDVVTANIFNDSRFSIVPIIVLEDAHLCHNLREIVSIMLPFVNGGKVKLVLVAPSAHLGISKSKFDVQQKITPMRFVEVVEVVTDHIDLQLVLQNLKHFKGTDRLDNLKSSEKVQSLLEELRQAVEEKLDLWRYFRCYMLCGGTAYAVYGDTYKDSCMKLCVERGCNAMSQVIDIYFKTVDEVAEDGEAKNMNSAVVKALLYFFVERTHQGLEIGVNEILEKAQTYIQSLLLTYVEPQTVKHALTFLRQSDIIKEVKVEKVKLDGDKKPNNTAKYIFEDPRYFISAYLHKEHNHGNREYPSAFRDLCELITSQDNGTDRLFSHYLEEIVLVNLARGAYATSVSAEHPDKSPNEYKYIKSIKLRDEQSNESEIDAMISLQNNIKILFEVSTPYDRSHVEKCNRAVDMIRAGYCIYGTLDMQGVENSGKTILAPLPYALLLF